MNFLEAAILDFSHFIIFYFIFFFTKDSLVKIWTKLVEFSPVLSSYSVDSPTVMDVFSAQLFRLYFGLLCLYSSLFLFVVFGQSYILSQIEFGLMILLHEWGNVKNKKTKKPEVKAGSRLD